MRDESLEIALSGPVVRAIADVSPGPIRDRLLTSINLMDNYTRGRVAEVIVAEAIGGECVGDGYGMWDVQLGALRIEVKASGAVQSWPQQRASAPSFSIRRASGWIEQSDGSFLPDDEKKRRSDVYVFAHHVGARPDDHREWRFFVVATDRIDVTCGDQKTIGLASVIAMLDPIDCDFGGLAAAIAHIR